jgi:hypothetical protein
MTNKNVAIKIVGHGNLAFNKGIDNAQHNHNI